MFKKNSKLNINKSKLFINIDSILFMVSCDSNETINRTERSDVRLSLNQLIT